MADASVADTMTTVPSLAAFQYLECLRVEYCNLYERCQWLEKENEAMRVQILSGNAARAAWEPARETAVGIVRGTPTTSVKNYSIEAATSSEPATEVMFSTSHEQAVHNPSWPATVQLGDNLHMMLADTSNLGSSNSLFSYHQIDTKISNMASEVLPQFLQLWTVWLDATFEARPTSPTAVCGRRTSVESECRRSKDIIRAGDSVTDKSCLQKFVLRPDSNRRVAWDLLSAFAIAYDVTMVPLQAFPLKESAELAMFNRVVTVFWTLDIGMSFLLGFYDWGVLEMRPKAIAKKYLRSSFWFDFSVVVVDWCTMIFRDRLADVTGVLRMGKSLRLSRVLRTLRLLRAMKLFPLLGQYSELIRSDNLITIVNIIKLLLAIVFVNHFIACGWYAIGNLDMGNDTPTWVMKLELNEGQECSTLYLYATSLHWSLTQFTPASMEVVPRNALERSFAICVLMSGLVMFSSLVSSITNTMTKLRERNLEQTRQQDSLRQFLRDARISVGLGNRVLQYLRHSGYTPDRRVLETEVAVFKLLPEKLRKELRCETYTPILRPHPFFYHFDEHDGACFISICHLAMTQKSVAKGEKVFDYGEKASQMLFVIGGSLEYFPGAADSDDVRIFTGDYVSEGALWLKWEHHGRLLSWSISSELVGVDSSTFRTIVRKSPLLPSCCRYARSFQQLIIEAEDATMASTSARGRLSDVWGSFDMSQEIAQRCFEEQVAQMGGCGDLKPSLSKFAPIKRQIVKLLSGSSLGANSEANSDPHP